MTASRVGDDSVRESRLKHMSSFRFVRSLASIVAIALSCACQTVEDVPPRWRYLHAAIIQPSCTTAGCHSGLTAIAGVNLADPEGAYTVLTGRICGVPTPLQAAPRNYVTPGSAEYSQLIYQLRGVTADGLPVRSVMPPDTPLPELEIELVARWIDAGAQCE
ncbi:MAG: hypothetical protein AB7O24_02170 [Kofleriaceae bacterium]